VGGDGTVGLIDSNGLYHAPATVPSPATVSVVAVSFEDQKVFATSTVTITPAPIVAITSPAGPVTVASGSANTVNFSATETGGSSNVITWSVGLAGGLPVPGGNSTVGTIDANGVYRPPPTPPTGQTVLVTAAAQDSPTSTASLAVTISGYTNSSLQGQFAFSMAGSNASGHFFRAGSFIADGAGNLNNVMEDVNDGSGNSSNAATGTYMVATDGRGTLLFNDGLTPASFDFVLVNGTQLQIIGFESTGTATGQANAQDTTTFTGTPLSAMNGTYVFDFSGVDGANGLQRWRNIEPVSNLRKQYRVRITALFSIYLFDYFEWARHFDAHYLCLRSGPDAQLLRCLPRLCEICGKRHREAGCGIHFSAGSQRHV
jgi:hypothetical protein